jgi:hypothetical protein
MPANLLLYAPKAEAESLDVLRAKYIRSKL